MIELNSVLAIVCTQQNESINWIIPHGQREFVCETQI